MPPTITTTTMTARHRPLRDPRFLARDRSRRRRATGDDNGDTQHQGNQKRRKGGGGNGDVATNKQGGTRQPREKRRRGTRTHGQTHFDPKQATLEVRVGVKHECPRRATPRDRRGHFFSPLGAVQNPPGAVGSAKADGGRGHPSPEKKDPSLDGKRRTTASPRDTRSATAAIVTAEVHPASTGASLKQT